MDAITQPTMHNYLARSSEPAWDLTTALISGAGELNATDQRADGQKAAKRTRRFRRSVLLMLFSPTP